MLARHAHGAGLGFRRELIAPLKTAVPEAIRFFELAPENWAGMGGRSGKELRHFTERYPFVCHGLSLSLGGPGPLDEALLHRIKAFMAEHGMTLYTEHLSWCADDSHLYDLLPIPLTENAVKWTAERIKRAQDILGQRIGIENASYYVAPPGAEMSETDFISAIVREADCLLHLDVNNIYVNSCNFGFDPFAFMNALPLDRTCYVHVAGHWVAGIGSPHLEELAAFHIGQRLFGFQNRKRAIEATRVNFFTDQHLQYLLLHQAGKTPVER